MKEIVTYKDLNLSELEEQTQQDLINGSYTSLFCQPDIIVASIFGDSKKLEYLLSKKNININETNEFGRNALESACVYFGFTHTNYKIMQILLDNKINTIFIEKPIRKTLLHCLFSNRCFSSKKRMNTIYAIKILLDYGIDINYQDNDGKTLLMQIVTYSNANLIKVLLDEKINIHAKNNLGVTAFDINNNIILFEGYTLERSEISKLLQNYKYNDAIFRLFEHYDTNLIYY